MDDDAHDEAGKHDLFAEAHRQLEEDERDLLDAPVLPLLGLSFGTLTAIFVGGALGTMARYLFEAHHSLAPGTFPWVTLVVNLSGSLAIGLLIPVTEHTAHRVPLLRPLIIIGFLGGWTTYSTLAVESVLLAQHSDVGICLAYLAATVGGGLTSVVVGHSLGRQVTVS